MGADVIETPLELLAGLDRDGSIILIALVGGQDFTEKLDLEELLAMQAGHYLAGEPRGYPTKADRRSVEVSINNFERQAKRAVKAGRASTARFKTWRELGRG